MQKENRLIIKDEFGTVWIESWGKNSVRVRMTLDRKMDDESWALEEKICPENLKSEISIKTVDTTYPWAEHFQNHHILDYILRQNHLYQFL